MLFHRIQIETKNRRRRKTDVEIGEKSQQSTAQIKIQLHNYIRDWNDVKLSRCLHCITTAYDSRQPYQGVGEIHALHYITSMCFTIKFTVLQFIIRM